MATVLDLDVAIRQYTLLLDTTLLIDEFTRQVAILGRIPRPQRRTSSVAVWEFFHRQDGQLISPRERIARRTWMDDQDIRYVWISPRSEQSFHNLLWRASYPPGVVDCLLAAESITRKWPLVTRNSKHFDDVAGIVVVPY